MLMRRDRVKCLQMIVLDSGVNQVTTEIRKPPKEQKYDVKKRTPDKAAKTAAAIKDRLRQLVPALISQAQWDEAQGWWFYVQDYSNATQAAHNDNLVWRKPDGDYWVGQNPPERSTQLGVWYPRAVTLGGCDTHNGGLTVLPSEWDWDSIANQTGDTSWTHDRMVHYFERIERNLFLPPGTPGHGFHGYQPVGRGDKSLFEKEPQILASNARIGGCSRAYGQSS
ncbi:hypothetical protein F4776DRAFT_662873 [Hypoxylon sp. NC0597]|nr:hypothetical protein F4776DRAFT_662873 [Hypoxylon sp. NC0597]